MICGRTVEKLEEAQKSAGLRRHLPSTGRPGRHGGCDRFVDQVVADHGPVDILINNAGRSIRRAIEYSYDRFHDFERTMQINYYSPLRLSLRVLPGMSERRRGHVINISSMGVIGPPPPSRPTSRRSRRSKAGRAAPKPNSPTARSTSPTSTCRWCARR